MKRFIKFLLTLMGSLVLASALTVLVATVATWPKSPTDHCARGEALAYTATKDYIRSNLKSPSSARFSSLITGSARVHKRTHCDYSVVGYVDAQNGFGAMVRNHFHVEVSLNPTSYQHTFTLISME